MDILIPGAIALLALQTGAQKKAKVLNKERLLGVHPSFTGLLRDWEFEGSFDILVAPDGGYRIGPADEAKQAKFYRDGASKAATLKDTPHGRGAAIDVWPYAFKPSVPLNQQLGVKNQFLEFAEFAKARGFIAGADWGWDFPHIEMKNWLSLPWPPRQWTTGVA